MPAIIDYSAGNWVIIGTGDFIILAYIYKN